MDVPSWVRAARDQWSNRGQARPPFAEEPGPGQESVWDYPRPPAVVPDQRTVEVRTHDGRLLARTDRSIRILETSHPPTFYLPPDSVEAGVLVPAAGSSHCEWKGRAEYLAIAEGGPGEAVGGPGEAVGGPGEAVGWRYPSPYEGFDDYAGWVSFYPARVTCTVAGERVRPQAGGFYGGWITDDVVGPFKGEAGSSGW